MYELIKAKQDVKLLIENEIEKFIDNSSASFAMFKNTYLPLSFTEIDDFMRLMTNRYSHKAMIRSAINPENFTVQIKLEKLL